MPICLLFGGESAGQDCAPFFLDFCINATLDLRLWLVAAEMIPAEPM